MQTAGNYGQLKILFLKKRMLTLQLNKEILLNRITQLIDITKGFLYYSKELKNLHDKFLPEDIYEKDRYRKSEIPLMLRMLHNSFFFDALLNLNSILSKVQKDVNKKEQSIFELIELESDANQKNRLLQAAEKFSASLKEKNLDKWRHKLVGHKDINQAGDTDIMYLNFIIDDIHNHTAKLLDDIYIFINNNYDVISNTSFSSLYSNSFERMIELFKKDLAKYKLENNKK